MRCAKNLDKISRSSLLLSEVRLEPRYVVSTRSSKTMDLSKFNYHGIGCCKVIAHLMIKRLLVRILPRAELLLSYLSQWCVS